MSQSPARARALAKTIAAAAYGFAKSNLRSWRKSDSLTGIPGLCGTGVPPVLKKQAGRLHHNTLFGLGVFSNLGGN